MRTMIVNNTHFFIIQQNCVLFLRIIIFLEVIDPTKHKGGLGPYSKKSDFLVGTYYMI
jgi:hypothetical protein